jgi:anti-sigma factor RsiW
MDDKDRCLLYDAGELEPAEAAEFERHLARCSECRDWLALARRARAWSAAAAETPPAALVSRALAR